MTWCLQIRSTPMLSASLQGLRLADAFLLFDYDGDGVLGPSELYGGLEWLGVKLLPAEVMLVAFCLAARAAGVQPLHPQFPRRVAALLLLWP